MPPKHADSKQAARRADEGKQQMAELTEKPNVIGIAGETASGKSTFCAQVVDRSPPGGVTVLSLDSYYRSQSHLPAAERATVNFDHPDSFDYPLLIDHVDQLCRGLKVHVPIYDFAAHARLLDTEEKAPAPIVIVEGILALYWEELRDRFDLMVFIDAPENIRLQRRIDRDTTQRGRTRQSVLHQWDTSVQTSSRIFCAPTKRFANLIVDGQRPDQAAFGYVLDRVISQCGNGAASLESASFGGVAPLSANPSPPNDSRKGGCKNQGAMRESFGEEGRPRPQNGKAFG